MSDSKSLSVDLLRLDADTQNRLKINEEAVEDYAEIIAESNGKWPFSQIEVFHDGIDYYVSDGFHRTLGAKRAKRSSVPCSVHKGTARDARIFGMTANDQHGMRMSRADKRACVEWLLDNEPKMTQEEIGRKSGVSKRLVQIIVSDRKFKKAQIAPQLGGGNSQRRFARDRRIPAGESASSFMGERDTVISGSSVQPGAVTTAAPGEASSDSGKDERKDSTGKKPQDSSPRPSRSDTDKPGDFGTCPNCGGKKWTEDEFGAVCAKCNHPHGEPVGDQDEGRVGTQRAKTVKTVEALLRAFDDLNRVLPKQDHVEAIASCKFLLKTARAWK